MTIETMDVDRQLRYLLSACLKSQVKKFRLERLGKAVEIQSHLLLQSYWSFSQIFLEN